MTSSIPTRCTLSSLSFVLAVFAVLMLCVGAEAQDSQIKEAPRQTDADKPQFSKVCPSEALFPSASGPRGSYANGWQQDYPTVVFNAQDGVSYWLDYSPSPSLTRLSSIFTPVTYTTEKVLVLICGLHFNATAAAVPTTESVSDGGPQIDLSAAGSSLPTPAVAPAAPTPPAQNIQPDVQNVQPSPPAPTVQPCPSDIDKAAGDANDSYNDARSEVARLLSASGLLEESPFTFAKLKQEIFVAIPAENSWDPHNLTTFNRSLSLVRSLATRLATSTSTWNSLVQGTDFASAWSALGKAKEGVKVAEDKRKAAACQPDSGAVTDAQLDADRSDFDTIKKDLDKATAELRAARANLLSAYEALDSWYSRSSVSTVLILPPVSSNSLTRLVVQVSDPWVPLAPGAMNIAGVKPPTKTKKPMSTTITIDRSDSKKPTITVGTGDGATATTTVTDGSKKATVVIGGALNVSSTVTATVTDDPNKPISTVQVAQTTGAAGSTPVPNNGAAGTPTSGTQTSGTQTPAPPVQSPDKAVVATSAVPNATYLLARHRFVNFVPTGGLLVSRFSSPTFNLEALPLTTNTTTVTTTEPASSSGSTNPCLPPTGTAPCSPPVVTITSVNSTANFAVTSPSGSFQETGIAGITWFPFGRDTYSVTRLSPSNRPHTGTYAAYDPLSHLGIFAGTSVASLGPFVISPTYEVKPGIEFFAGLSLMNKTTLTSGIIPCASPGTSTINQAPVNSSSTSNGLTTTSTVTVQLVTGCSNASATMLTGATIVPTQTTLVPAFSFGFLLNANLFQFLGW